MRIMTIGAENILLRHGMAARQCEGRLYFLVARITHSGRIPGPYRQVEAAFFKGLADAVTIYTGDIVHCMGVRIPVMQVKGRIGSVALKTYKGLCLRREIFDVDKGLVITGSLLALFCIFFDLFRSDTFYGETSRSVA